MSCFFIYVLTDKPGQNITLHIYLTARVGICFLLSFNLLIIQPFFFLPLDLLPSIPVVSTPFLPALPAICLYVRGSNKCPLKVGVRMMTLRAGRLTPEDSVEVAARTLTRPCRNAPSNTSRSSNVKPTETNFHLF